MAYENNFVTMIGNLTDEPQLRFTGSGIPVVGMRIASSRRWTGQDGQQREETIFIDVNAWRELAENAAETLHKGDRAIVIGRLKTRSYENKENQTVWVTEIEADEIAPSLRWARATVEKTNRSSNVGAGASASHGNGDGGSVPPPSDDVPF